MKEFLKNNYQVAKSSIETTLRELIDIRDALDNAKVRGKKYDALQGTIDAYEKLRRNFLDGQAPTTFEACQWQAIFKHRQQVLTRKLSELQRAKDDYDVLVKRLDLVIKNLNSK